MGSDDYRAKSLLHLALAHAEPDLANKARHLTLAQSYIRLAYIADKNATADLVYETPLRPTVPGAQPIPQQRQQQQQREKPKPDEP